VGVRGHRRSPVGCDLGVARGARRGAGRRCSVKTPSPAVLRDLSEIGQAARISGNRTQDGRESPPVSGAVPPSPRRACAAGASSSSERAGMARRHLVQRDALPAGETGRAISRGGVAGSSPGAYPGGAGLRPAPAFRCRLANRPSNPGYRDLRGSRVVDCRARKCRRGSKQHAGSQLSRPRGRTGLDCPRVSRRVSHGRGA